ncbi:MAG: hypothetical protein HQL70_03050 [Magnetococcales bacterium]|nr:hypothetical protein [Magnetococcales bacterium]
MRQHINLLRPEFMPRETRLSAKTMLLLAGISIIMAIFSYQAERNITRENEKLALLHSQQKKVLKNIDDFAGYNQPDISKTQKLMELKQQLAAKNAILSSDIELDITAPKPFSNILQQIAQAQIPGVWLTKVTISNTGEPWIVEGYATRTTPGLIPQYLKRLASQFNPQQPQFAVDKIGETGDITKEQTIATDNNKLFFRLLAKGI